MTSPTPASVPIDLDFDIYDYAKANSTFEDTINTVLRRLLGLPESGEAAASGSPGDPPTASASTAPAAAPARASTRHAGGKRSAAKTKRKRAQAGTLLPESEYHRPILETLNERGGRASKNEVMEEVGQRLQDRLTDADRELLDSGGIRWQSRTQFARLRLVDRGLMDREAPRGVWAITADGIKALEEGTV